MSDSDESGIFTQLFVWLVQLVFVMFWGAVVVDTAFHPKDPLIFVVLLPIGIAIFFGFLWLVDVVGRILGAAFQALQARWRRRQRGW